MRTDDTLPRDDEVGADLREAYRHIATETTPSYLDKAVLEAARSARTPARPGLWQWRRPLAWVTMIGLSFAIVLEFSQTGTDLVPALEETLPRTAPPDTAKDTPAAIAADGEPAADTTLRLAPAIRRNETVDDAERAARQALEDSVATKTELDKRSRDEALEAMSAPAAAEFREYSSEPIESAVPATTGAPDAGAPGTATSKSAERSRDDADRQADLYIEQGTAEKPACDETTRADPQRWRACIMDLLEAERTDEAIVEIGLYRRAHPDEPPPLPTK